LQESNSFSSNEGVRRDVGLSGKDLEALTFEKKWSKKQSRRIQAIAFEAGRFKFQKRSDFLNGERERQAVVYMEGALIVGLVSFHLFSMYK